MGDAKCERCGRAALAYGDRTKRCANAYWRSVGASAFREQLDCEEFATFRAPLDAQIATLTRERDAAIAEAAGLRANVPPPTAPVQLGYGRNRAPAGTPGSVPWAIHVRAWESYAGHYGKDQSATRIAERGGFGWEELDEHFPGWRKACDFERRAGVAEVEAAGLRARLEEAEARWRAAEAQGTMSCTAKMTDGLFHETCDEPGAVWSPADVSHRCTEHTTNEEAKR